MQSLINIIDELPYELRLPLIKAFEYFRQEIADTVKKSDFDELKAVVKELAEAQKRTEQRLEELAEAQKRTEQRLEELAEAQKRTEQRLEELAEAQKRTEQRLEELAEAQKRTEQRLEELAEAQKRTEQRLEELAEAQKKSEERIDKLEQTVQELAEAQKRSEERLTRLEQTVQELAEAQKRSEERLTRLEQTVQELAEAQKRTEEELRELTKEHKITRQLVVNLSDTVGYGLEDKLFPYMKDFAQKEYGIKVKKLGRKNLVYANGKYDELNIFIEGYRGEKPVYVIGECKAQLGKKDIDKFSQVLKRVSKHLNAEVEGFLVSYTISPEVEKYIEDFYPELKFYYSYHFELNYKRLQEN